ncbi:MAG TPA: hypothetical protein VLT82_09810 [Myxococcaceae bacterium]|nr:hypothetical protein [Myxococcaceae bacterium]
MLAPLLTLSALVLGASPDPLASIRAESRALVLIQQTLQWYTATVGETSFQAETYLGHDRLFSRESIARARKAAQAPGISADERRAREFLQAYLAGEFLSQSTAAFDDRAQNAELRATARLPWIQEPVPYKQLDLLVADERDAGRRVEIEKAKAEIWKTVLNPILAEKEATAQRLARELGYRSYVELSEESRRVQLRPFMVEGKRFLDATDGLFRQLLEEVSQRELGISASQLRRSDFSRLFKAPRLERFFPADIAVPSFTAFLGGMGLDFKTVAGTEVRVDDSLNPLKEPRAACWGIRVPEDVRINVKPLPGLDSLGVFFHEGGHAVLFANTTSRVWEFQQLGPLVFTEGLGEVFRYSWADPLWLGRYRSFVQAHNARSKRNDPLMSDQDIRDLSRLQLLYQLYYLRRYAYAKLVYESVLHGGSPGLWKGLYDRPTSDPMAVYRDVFSTAYAVPMDESDALRFRTDVDDTFYSVDYARAFALAHLIHEGMRSRFGADWYGNPEAGRLIKTLVADGNKPQPDEVAKVFGIRFDLRPAEARIRRLAAETSGR